MVSVRVRFGLTDTEPRAWDGQVSVDGGRILNLRSWRPHPGDRLEGTTGWRLSSRAGLNFQKRAWEPEPNEGRQSYINPTGLIIDVQSSGSTRLRFNTKNGSFDLKPGELGVGQPQALLGGAVVADRVATADIISSTDLPSDFATLVAGEKGELWAGWVAYAGGKNQVMARRSNGSSWEAASKVSEDQGDVFLVKAGAMRKAACGSYGLRKRATGICSGAVSPQATWSYVERLTQSRSRMSTRLWRRIRRAICGWCGRVSAMASRISSRAATTVRPGRRKRVFPNLPPTTGSRRSLPTARAMFTSPGTPTTRATTTWSCGTTGKGKWSEASAVAATPKFEAHVTLACDTKDRLWAAWNESGTQWGKDTGFLLYRQGTPLYRSRWVAVTVQAEGSWQEPFAEIEESLPEDLRGYQRHAPACKPMRTWTVWLFFRHRRPRILDTPSDTPMHRAAWELYATSLEGDRWTTPIAIPFSQGRTGHAVRGGQDGRGNLPRLADGQSGLRGVPVPARGCLRGTAAAACATVCGSPAEAARRGRNRDIPAPPGRKSRTWRAFEATPSSPAARPTGSIGATRTATRSSPWTATTTAAWSIPIATR